MIRVAKEYHDDEEALLVARWYNSVKEGNKPKNIVTLNGILSYDMVEGTYPRDLGRVMGALQWGIWDHGDGDRLEIDVGRYVSYCMKRASAEYENGIVIRAVRKACVTLVRDSDKLTPVNNCHGDATLLNMIHTLADDGDDRIVFIDPSFKFRLLPCREIDMAKVLQSVVGYDFMRCGHTRWYADPVRSSYAPFEVTPVIRALLVTHLMRLLRHQAARPNLVEWAIEEIERQDSANS